MRLVTPLYRVILGTFLLLITTIAVADDAKLSLFAFKSGKPVSNVVLKSGDQTIGETSEKGAIFFSLSPEGHELNLEHQGQNVLTLPLSLVPDESVQILVTLFDEGAPRVSIESSNKATEMAGAVAAQTDPQELGDPGTLSGKIVSIETGEPIPNVRVFVSGTPLDLKTDQEGRFAVELAVGTYSVSFLHSDHSTQTVDDIQVTTSEVTDLAVELVPAALELPEFVVLEPFVEGSLASVLDEQRNSAGVANVLGAESISRAGDSDAAGALKRVTGLTLVDGQFVYVRGLGERYSSTLLNSANVPSPDPTRRVVPLNLFPADILASVIVTKSYEANLPAEFGGGSINLRTSGIPESTFFRASISTAHNGISTFEDGLTYQGGSDDFLGTDDGIRDFPDPDFAVSEEIAESLPAIYTPFNRRLEADQGLGFSGGYRGSAGDFDFGVLAVASWSQQWRQRDEVRRTFNVFNSNDGVQLVPETDFDLAITRRFVSQSLFTSAGVAYGDDHQVNLTLMRLRSTEDEAEVREGTEIEGDFIRETTLEFEERELSTYQLSGEHKIPALKDLEVSWLYSDASTVRDAPDERSFRYTRIGEDTFRFNLSADGNSRSYSFLEDSSENYKLDLRFPLNVANTQFLFSAGINRVEKDRDSFIRRFRFECRSRDCRARELLEQPNLEDILTPDTIGDTGFILRERTLVTDTYFATQEVDGEYLQVDANWNDKLRLVLGVRQEAFNQEVVTFDRFNTSNSEVSLLDTDELYPAFSSTYFVDDSSQLRFSYGETVTRPEFREVSRSIFTEPRLDVIVTGNPDLVPVSIKNYDLRYEKYLDTVDNVSVALFYKELTNPIELIARGGAADTVEYDNAETAEIQGLEVEAYKTLSMLEDWTGQSWLGRFYLAGNITYIQSNITLGEDAIGRLTNESRDLQGQSPYVVNMQLGYDDPDRGIKATLLYNVTGERISFVGTEGAPDIFEQPFDQIDFVYSQRFFSDQLGLKVKLKNLLDDDVEFTQGDEIVRGFTRGREVSIGLDWRF